VRKFQLTGPMRVLAMIQNNKHNEKENLTACVMECSSVQGYLVSEA
jgi:hypothetical protein